MSREQVCRALKAQRLANAILALNMDVTADDVAAFPLDSIVWKNLADLATELELRAGTIGEKERVHPPHSAETVAAICAELRRAADVAELISGPPSSGMQRRAG